jgi:hypothetical protein
MEYDMSQNPLNLALRFILELIALFAVGFWGWSHFDGALRFLTAIGLPFLAAFLWGTFRVPEDASANGKAPVTVPGWLRLLLELGLFVFATWGLLDAGAVTAAYVFGGVSLLHYLISYDRILWLLRR